MYLNRKNISYSNSSGIIWMFIEENVKNCKHLRDFLLKYKNLTQFVYNTVYRYVYSSIENT